MATPEEMLASMIANMKEKTGRTLPQWIKIAGSAKLEKHGQLVKWLKSEHGITHGYANLIAQQALSADTPPSGAGEDLVEAQYDGAKAGLRPIYDALVAAVKRLGGDIEIAPKKSYVSLRRNQQFGLIQPSTKTRVDLGVNLKGEPPTKRLEASGSFNAMVSHRVRLTDAGDVDAELKRWLKKAYDAS